jgi:hypothetical protein
MSAFLNLVADCSKTDGGACEAGTLVALPSGRHHCTGGRRAGPRSP